MKKSDKRKPVSSPVIEIEAANPVEVAAILREAARRTVIDARNPKRDQRLLKAARSAQHQGGSFTDMYHTVTAVNGTIELLYQLINPRGDVPDDVNWVVVADLLDDARRRIGDVYCGLAELRQFERGESGAEC